MSSERETKNSIIERKEIFSMEGMPVLHVRGSSLGKKDDEDGNRTEEKVH